VLYANLADFSGGKMKLELARYKCSTCANIYTAPSLGESAYGEFLLWSESGSVAYLNALEDPTFKEVDSLLLLHPKASMLPPLERAKVLRKIYGRLACDVDEHGVPFSIDASPPCPSCGGQQLESWELTNPAEVVDISVKEVTHVHWYALSIEEKYEQLSMNASNALPSCQTPVLSGRATPL